MTLLIHSMAEFASIIQPTLEAAKVESVTEIGSEFGGMSRILADHCANAGGTLTCIDPSPASDFADWAAAHEAVRHIARPSLDVIAEMDAPDAWVIDGDHNYFTVLHELRAIDAVMASGGQPMLAFLHDVSWPCARRDTYYAPDRIPAEWRHPHSYDHGVTLDSDAAVPDRGFRGAGQFSVALKAGGPRNGVLTAVEDYLAAADSDERPLCYVHVPAVFGLGIIFDAGADWAQEIANLLMPYHQNDLIARLEENRLRNYLKVIDEQDNQAQKRQFA